MRRNARIVSLKTTLLAAAFWLGPRPAAQTPAQGVGRPVPENAVARPGIDTVGYPQIGPVQKWRIGQEIVASTADSLARRPVGSLEYMLGRSLERVSVRARELAGLAGGPAPHGGGPADGEVDGPFGSVPMPARLTLLPTSQASVDGLLGLIAAASARVDLMIYGWEDDPTGRAVAEALAAAGARGVKVRVLADLGGILMHNPGVARRESGFLDRLAGSPNVRVILPPNPFVRFDHRKLAVADGRVAWSGGMILTEVARTRWENLAFLAEGRVAGQYAALFEDRWREVGGDPEGPTDPSTPMPLAPPNPNAAVRLLRTDDRERSLKNALYHAVDHARHRIYVENPYFSDTIFAEKLVQARRRGVDVRVVVTLRGNVEKLNRFVVLTSNRLMRGGVAVYLAPGMTHVKAMSVDGTWAYLGTGNFDELSLRNNREVGLGVRSPAVVEALDGSVFGPDMARAQRLEQLLPVPRDWLRLQALQLWF